jgi:hypothetical protein
MSSSREVASGIWPDGRDEAFERGAVLALPHAQVVMVPRDWRPLPETPPSLAPMAHSALWTRWSTELAGVAAAIQVQVSRDFRPIWGVDVDDPVRQWIAAPIGQRRRAIRLNRVTALGATSGRN